MSHYNNSLQQAVFFKISSQYISTPHWRDFQMLECLFESVKHGETPVTVLERALNTFKEALDNELTIINRQLTAWLSQGHLPSRMHYLAIACANLISAVFDCIIVLNKGKSGNFDHSVSELKKKVLEHEMVRENIISLSEQEGWTALQHNPGEFTPVVFILEWCITTYVTGYSTRFNFKEQLKWLEDIVQSTCKKLESSCDSQQLTLAETDFIEVLNLVRFACLSGAPNRQCSVDFLELRGLFGVIAKSLSRLNELAGKNKTKNQAKTDLPLGSFDYIPLNAFPKIFTNSNN